MAWPQTLATIGAFILGGSVTAFALSRREAPGLILEVSGGYYVQESVVRAFVERGRRPIKMTNQNTIDMLLVSVHRRGVVEFRLAEWWVDHPRYGKLYLVSTKETYEGLPAERLPPARVPEVRDILIEFAAYGFARPGLSFTSREALGRGDGKPLQLEIVRTEPREVEVRVEVERRRPSGSYFKIGRSYYADTQLLERLEVIPGSKSDDKGQDVTVPIWKRGWLKFVAIGNAQMFPEQRGALYRLDPDLKDVELEDLLTELVDLGLAGWGGEWNEFPKKRLTHPPTGTPSWTPAGQLLSTDSGDYVDGQTLSQILPRLHTETLEDGKIRVRWRTHTVDLRPTAASGRVLYHVEPADDPGVKAFLGELILRRIASRPDEKFDAPGVEKPVTRPLGIGRAIGHVYQAPSGLWFVDGVFAERLLEMSRGTTYEADRIILRFTALTGDTDVAVLTPITRRSGPQLFFLFPDQAGELYDVDLRMTPAAWQALVQRVTQAGHGRVAAFPISPTWDGRPGHIYTIPVASGIFVDGALMIHLRQAAAEWVVNKDGKDVTFTMNDASGREVGIVVLRDQSSRFGATPANFPDQAGQIYEVIPQGPRDVRAWQDFVMQHVAERKIVRIEVAREAAS
jgi:hypothetical protein